MRSISGRKARQRCACTARAPAGLARSIGKRKFAPELWLLRV